MTAGAGAHCPAPAVYNVFMTEQEWRDCTDPQSMLSYLSHRATAGHRRWLGWFSPRSHQPGVRKPLLFALACYRTVWHLLAHPGNRDCCQWMEAVERYAEGLIRAEELAPPGWDTTGWDTTTFALSLSGQWSDYALRVGVFPSDDEGVARHRRYQADVLRDIIGPLPFRPVALNLCWPSWNHGTVPALARRIYDERAFHDLPILADALEDAGCTDEDILMHCRQPGEHVRGCWVVDLLLGKE